MRINDVSLSKLLDFNRTDVLKTTNYRSTKERKQFPKGKGTLYGPYGQPSFTSSIIIIEHHLKETQRNFLYGLPASSSCICCHHSYQNVRIIGQLNMNKFQYNLRITFKQQEDPK